MMPFGSPRRYRPDAAGGSDAAPPTLCRTAGHLARAAETLLRDKASLKSQVCVWLDILRWCEWVLQNMTVISWCQVR
jgi:hypothetical protein